jgi:hypothetical protein
VQPALYGLSSIFHKTLLPRSLLSLVIREETCKGDGEVAGCVSVCDGEVAGCVSVCDGEVAGSVCM